MEPTTFEVMQYMSENNDPALQGAPLSNISHASYSKKGTKITIGFPGNLVGKIAQGRLVGGLILIDSVAFEAAKMALIERKQSALGRG